MSENGAKNSDSMTNDVRNDGDETNNKTNTLKNVKRKIRRLATFRKNEKPQVIVDEKSDKVDNDNNEQTEKGKFTIKKIFRKSSFRKIISNLQQFTNFTVSTHTQAYIRPFIH